MSKVDELIAERDAAIAAKEAAEQKVAILMASALIDAAPEMLRAAAVTADLANIVGKVIIYAALSPHEEPVDPPAHAAIDAVLWLKEERTPVDCLCIVGLRQMADGAERLRQLIEESGR